LLLVRRLAAVVAGLLRLDRIAREGAAQRAQDGARDLAGALAELAAHQAAHQRPTAAPPPVG
jgi:hypothetical protein